MSTWQETLSNMASTGMFNTIHPIGSQIGFNPRPLVADTSYMPADAINLFVTTLGGNQVQMITLTELFPHM